MNTLKKGFRGYLRGCYNRISPAKFPSFVCFNLVKSPRHNDYTDYSFIRSHRTIG
jgi:hypothetical protein